MSGNANQFSSQGWGDQNGWENVGPMNPGMFAPDYNTGYRSDEMIVNADQLSYQSSLESDLPTGKMSVGPKMSFFYDKGYDYSKPVMGPPQYPGAVGQDPVDFDNEPPLLEELGIDPEQIMKKTMVVLDPFHASVPLGEYDLAGPLFFCLFLGLTMLMSGGKINFSYVYGLAVTGCLMMYCLLWLMSSGPQISLTSVASVLGYSLLPVLILSAISIFLTLTTNYGYVMAAFAVFWASLAASRMFVTMTTDPTQRPLIAYPCGLLYAVFTLLVLF